MPAPVQPARVPTGDWATRDDLARLREELLAKEVTPALDPLAPDAQARLKDDVADALFVIRREETVGKIRDYQEKRDARHPAPHSGHRSAPDCPVMSYPQASQRRPYQRFR